MGWTWIASVVGVCRRCGVFLLERLLDPINRRIGYIRPRAYGMVALEDRLVPLPFDRRYNPSESYQLLSSSNVEQLPDLCTPEDATVVDASLSARVHSPASRATPVVFEFPERPPPPRSARGTAPPPAPGKGWCDALRDASITEG